MMLRPNKPIVVESDIAEVVAQLERGTLSQGQIVKTLEHDCCSLFNRKYANAYSSATSAFDAIFEHILEPGDEVIISPFTFKSVPQAILRAGGKPVFIDIEDDYLPAWKIHNPGSLVTEKTKAVVVTHLYGMPDNSARWVSYAAQSNANIKVIEDCAQAIGSMYANGNLVGDNISYAAVFSFYATKNVTGAEGGMVVHDDAELEEALICLRNNERVGNRIGTNRRMSNLHAALAHSQLIRLYQITSHRNLIAGIYRQYVVAPHDQFVVDDGVHSYHQYTVTIDPRINRDTLLSRLKGYGIECGVYYDYLINYDSNYYDLLGVQYTPNAFALSQRCVSLPIGIDVSIQDAMFVANTFNEVYNELSRA